MSSSPHKTPPLQVHASSASQNPYSSLSNDDLLKEFISLYTHQVMMMPAPPGGSSGGAHSLPNASSSSSSSIQINAKAYLKTLDSQAELLDYIHLQSANLSGKLFPSLQQQQEQLQGVFAQIDALLHFVKSHRHQINHMNQVLHDVDAHTKTYSRFVPKFMRTKAKTKDSLAELNVERVYRDFDGIMRDMRRKMRLPEERQAEVSAESAPDIDEKVVPEFVDEEEETPREMLAETFVSVDLTTSDTPADEPETHDHDQNAQKDDSGVATNEAANVEDVSPLEKKPSSGEEMIAQQEESSEEDEGEVIIAEGEDSDEDD